MGGGEHWFFMGGRGSSHHLTQWVLRFSLLSCTSHSCLGGDGLLVGGKPKC